MLRKSPGHPVHCTWCGSVATNIVARTISSRNKLTAFFYDECDVCASKTNRELCDSGSKPKFGEFLT